MSDLSTIESIMENPDWESFQYFYICIKKREGKFCAELLFFASEEGDPHLVVQALDSSIAEALEALEEVLEEKLITNAAGHFLTEALEEEEEEK
jgi:hypothetical protein